MNKIIVLILLCSFHFAGCQENNTSESDGKKAKTKKAKTELEKKMSKRDLTINASNSFSDLFFDSSAMESYISDNKLSDTLARRMRSFYNSRNYQYAWFSSAGLTEQAYGFWNLVDYEVTAGHVEDMREKNLEGVVDKMISDYGNNGETVQIKAGDKNGLNIEFGLTKHFIRYTLDAYEDGYVKRKEMERFIPLKKEDALKIADSLLTKKHKDDKYFENVNQAYSLLKNELGTYYNIVANGGWGTIPLKKKLAPGISSPEIILIKKRLQITGDMPGSDSTAVFNDSLTTGVKVFQQRMGYKADGIVTEQLIKDMNVPANTRLQQILMNMGRMRWMPQEPEGKLVIVNIPEFILHFYEGKTKAFDMVVVVGKEGHNTMMFTGMLNQIVFSPYWNVPDNIVRKEIVPAIARNANYISNQNMEITGNRNGLPIVRQLPGEKNSLGRVKFLFPNSFDIYFHDTPSKSLFSKDKRAFSHGCIRLSDPVKLANYLLKDDKSWDTMKIQEAMFAEKEKFVKLKDPVPVFITYYTAWVDENGLLNFRDDIYKHDQQLSNKMFNGVSKTPSSEAKNLVQ